MLTRKHFETVAEALLLVKNTSARWLVADELAKAFKEENPRFDRAIFMNACGLNDSGDPGF